MHIHSAHVQGSSLDPQPFAWSVNGSQSWKDISSYNVVLTEKLAYEYINWYFQISFHSNFIMYLPFSPLLLSLSPLPPLLSFSPLSQPSLLLSLLSLSLQILSLPLSHFLFVMLRKSIAKKDWNQTDCVMYYRFINISCRYFGH